MPGYETLLEGLRLMGIGMGIVFGFLLLLVGVLRGMSAAVLRYAAQPGVSGSVDGAGTLPDAAEDGELVAAISAAIALYRKR
jgi:oxaloacetate decarboxylase gamma subunit